MFDGLQNDALYQCFMRIMSNMTTLLFYNPCP